MSRRSCRRAPVPRVRRRAPAAGAGAAGVRRARARSTVARDALWYPFVLASRTARRVDVLHCPTYRAPLRSSRAVVVTVHDLAVLRQPRRVQPLDAQYSRRLRPARRRAPPRAVIAVSEFTGASSSSCSTCRRSGCASSRTASTADLHARGPGRRGRLRARGRDARAAQEPAAARRGRAAALGVELRVVGEPGWGGVELAGDGVRWLGRVPDDGARAPLPRRALPRLRLALRGLRDPDPRGDGVRHAGRHDARPARSRRSPAARRCSSTRSTRLRSRAGIEEAGAARDELRAAGSSGATRVHVGARAPRRPPASTARRPRERPLVVLDADVLGRRRTGDETYVAEAPARAARAAAAAGLRFAALTRRPELVPPGVEPIELPARFQELRMACACRALLRRLRPALAHFQHALPLRCPWPAVVTVHDLSFERDPAVMPRKRPARCSARRPARRAARRGACSPSRSGRSATWSSCTGSRRRRSW